MDLDNPISQDVFSSPVATVSVGEVGASQADTQGSQDACIVEVQRDFTHLKEYFIFSVDAKDRVSAKCTQRTCGNVLKMQQHSVYNLKRHYKSHHPSLVNELLAAIKGGSMRGKHFSGVTGMATHSQKRQRRSSTEADLDMKFNQEKALNLYYRFIIEDMVPSSVMDSERLRELLKYLNPEFVVPSRKKLSRDLKLMVSKTRSELMQLLSQQDYVATPAASWKANGRCFLGMTVHWIDSTTIRRQKAVLGCEEVMADKAEELIALTICQTHINFGIQNKVQVMTTDNGANYVGMFENYNMEAQRQLIDAQVDAADSKVELDQEPEKGPLPDYDATLVHPVAVSVADALDNVKQDLNSTGWFWNQDFELPKHRRCGAHTINLLAAKDTAKVANWTTSSRPAFVETLAKATAVWTCQKRYTVVDNYQMRVKMKPPWATCWNSTFDALKQLLEQLEDPQNFMKFNKLLQSIPNVSLFVEEDLTKIKEYVTVMEPVVACLDTLQAEEKAYMGMFLPNLFIMKLKLEKIQSDGNLSHAKQLVDALLNQNGGQGFKARFGHLFEDDDLLMATALHPHYKLVAVKNMTKSRSKTDSIQWRLAEELAAKSGVEESQKEASVEDDPFLQALRQEDASENILNDIQAWNRRPVKVSLEVTRDMFPQDHREAWVELFIKYNTPLPSSAAVERLFSRASDVLRAKSFCLTAENFDDFIFMKGNMDIVQQHIISLKIQEEEELDA